MRISFVHGEDSAKAYQKYGQLIAQSQKRGFTIIPIANIKDVVSQSLFEDKLVFTLEKPAKVKPNDWKWFKLNADKYNSNLLIFYDGTAPAQVIRNLPTSTQVEKFEYPKIIFQFLESFYPGNSHNCLSLFNQLVHKQPVELIFHLLSRQLRDLYWVELSTNTLNLPIWRKNKLSQQAGKFGKKNLRRAISILSEIDIKSKTSDASLKAMLDLFIIKELK